LSVALRPIPKARTRQPGPQALARVNEKHWLAKDLAFIHSGFTPFIFGRPITNNQLGLRSTALMGTAHSALNGTLGFSPLTGNYLTYNLPVPLAIPLTLSAWWYGPSSGTGVGVISIKSVSGEGGVQLGKNFTNNLTQVRSRDSGGSNSDQACSGGFVAEKWLHCVGVIASNTSRTPYTDGANAITSTVNRVVPTDLSELRLSANVIASPTAATTGVIRAFALPMVINRALSAEEVARLYEEQLSNPWGIFAERPIWVPVSAAGGFRAAWVRRASQVIGAR